MHYKAFNAKTLSYNIHFLLKKKLFRANCIALAHLLSIILSSYFPALLLLLSLSWNVISPLISSFLCLLIDMMRQKGPWRFGEDTPWGQRRRQCLTLAKKALNWDFGAFSSSAAKPPTFFVLFPFGTNTRILLYTCWKLAGVVVAVATSYLSFACSNRQPRRELVACAERRLLPMHTSVIPSFSVGMKTLWWWQMVKAPKTHCGRCGLGLFN